MAQGKLAQANQKYQVLQTQYNQLLQKNQNDLIAIRKKESSINSITEKLENEKQEIKLKLNNQINQLRLDMQKMKGMVHQSEKNVFSRSQSDYQKEINTMTDLFNLKQSRIQQLQISARKLIDNNIQLTNDISLLNLDIQQKETKIQKLSNEITKLKEELQKLIQMTKKAERITSICQTQGHFVSIMQLNNAKDQIEIKKKQQAQLRRQIQNLNAKSISNDQRNQLLKQRLKQTNQQLKKIIDKDKRNCILLRRKEQQIIKIQQQMDKLRKPSKLEKKKLQTQNSVECYKCKQYSQQVKLLKQMVRSVQTMVRVREIEAEKYKVHNNQSHHKQKQSTKSNDKFPPINKKN